jgi:hypothetical protein
MYDIQHNAMNFTLSFRHEKICAQGKEVQEDVAYLMRPLMLTQVA